MLTAQERKRFIQWLDNEASDNRILVEQMKKIDAPKEMIATYESHAKAASIIAAQLRLFEK